MQGSLEFLLHLGDLFALTSLIVLVLMRFVGEADVLFFFFLTILLPFFACSPSLFSCHLQCDSTSERLLQVAVSWLQSRESIRTHLFLSLSCPMLGHI